MISIRIVQTGNMDLNFMKNITRKLTLAVTNLVNIADFTARKTFLTKRISVATSSPLFASFVTKLEGKNSSKIQGYFMSGSDKAYYAKYVENDHKLVNQKMWSDVNPNAPYKFMEEGKQAISDNVEKEIEKALGVK